MNAGAARMRIRTSLGDFDFLLPGDLPGLFSYSSEIDYVEVERRSDILEGDPMWHRGRGGEVELALQLVVGASENIDDADDLIMYATKLMALTQSVKKMEGPDTVDVYIGEWFHRTAIVTGGSVGFKRPYDPDTGKPYVANVSLRLQYVYTEPPIAASFSLD